jgi:hypothetical protein
VSETVAWRTLPLVKLLKNKGLSVETSFTLPPHKVLLHRLFFRPSAKVPRSLLFYASYAKYLVESFTPRMIVTFMDSSLLSPFLRMEMSGLGKIVNIGHAVTNRDFCKAGMTDFDYYFLFGQKSLENLLSNEFRVGTTKAVLSGSIFLEEGFVLPPIDCNGNFLFFSAWAHHHHKKEVMRSFDIVAGWAENNPDHLLYVKLHPLEDTDYWARVSKKLKNVILVNSEVSIKECLNNVCMVIVLWSAASVEASLLNRPVIVVNDSDMDDDSLEVESFFPKRARSVEELQERIEEITRRKDYYDRQCNAYANYHLVKTKDSLASTAESLSHIANGEKIPFEMIIPGTTNH